jgi:nucleotide-binding universal stress UspA family protein
MSLYQMARAGRFSKVLVTIDGSPESMAAVDRAIEIAKNDGAELIAFNVMQLPVVSPYTPAVLNAALEKGTTEPDTWFGDIKRRAQDAGARPRHRWSGVLARHPLR